MPLKLRLIPVLYLQNGWMVRSELFSIHQVIGNPFLHVERMVQWDVDELIILDISSGDTPNYDYRRDDYRQKGAKSLLDLISTVASECRIPLTFGGRLKTIDDVQERIFHGADKITFNTAAHENPELVTESAKTFGSQAIVVSIDYRLIGGVPRVFRNFGRQDTGLSPVEFGKRIEGLGAGEILLTAIDRDGTAKGYDVATIARVAEAVRIPVIGCGGAGHMRHFLEGFEQTGAGAMAAGNIFHFTESAYPRAKAFLCQRRGDIRPPAPVFLRPVP